jgi:HD-like signal output (HDOD) protein
MPLVITSEFSPRARALKGLDKLPRFSAMTTHLMAKLARRDTEPAELAELVEKDTLLSAQVLRLANSAAFARATPIVSVKHAIAMVGVGAMRRFTLASSISNLFSRFRTAPSFSLTRFNLHSVATGTMVELLADELPVEFSGGAFLAGLLHDVGRLLIAATMPNEYETIVSLNALSRRLLIESERQVLGLDHAELSAIAIARWELDDHIRQAAQDHHQPPQSRPGGVPLSRVVEKADEFVNSLGMYVTPPAYTAQRTSLEFPGFKFSEERVIERFETEWISLGDMFH